MRLPPILLVILAFSLPASAETFRISDIDIQPQRDGDSFIITISGSDTASPKYEVFTLNNPDRLIIDLKQATYAAVLHSATSSYSSKLIKDIRTVSHQDGSMRYVLELNYPLSAYRSDLQQGTDNNYLLKVRMLMPELAKGEPQETETKTLLTPTDEPGILELRGTTASKLLDLKGTQHATIDAEEFIKLFGKPTTSSIVDVRGIEMLSSHESSELVLDLSGPAEHTLRILRNPLRAVLDINNARGQDRVNAQHLSDSLARKVRSGQHDGFLRVVVELSAPVNIQSFLLNPAKGRGYRLTLRISKAASVPPRALPIIAEHEEKFPPPRAEAELQEAILPLHVDSEDKGEIFALISSRKLSNSRLDGATFLDAVKPILSPKAFSSLAALKDQDQQVSFVALESEGLSIKYDKKNATLLVTTPPRARAVHYHNLHSRQQQLPADSGSAIMPASISAAVDVIAAETWNTGQTNAFTGELDGNVNINGWVFQNRSAYIQDSAAPWQRRETQLIKDWPEAPLRLRLGDIIYPVYGLMGSRTLSGVSVGTSFSIQPYNVTFPTSHHEFFLEQDAQVRVFVNDVQRTTLHLTAGPHDVFDFPLVDGVNRVRLEITDTFGRKRTLTFFDSLDQRLLRPGLAEYSLAAGVERDFTETGLNYIDSASAFSGFYRYGYSHTLTIGSHLEFDSDITMLGTSGIWSTTWGNLDYDIALSHDPQTIKVVSPAARIGYLYQNMTWGFSFGISWQDSRFATLTQRADDDNQKRSATAGVYLPLWKKWSSNLSLSTYDQWSGSSRSAERLSVSRNLSKDWRIGIELSHGVDFGVKDNIAMIEFYWANPTIRMRNSFGYEANAQEGYYAIDYARQGELGLDARNLTRRSPTQLTNQFNTSYVTSLTESSFSSLDIHPHLAGNTSLRTLSAGTALTYVDGEFAVSRPLHGQSFALIEAKPSIGDGRLGVIRGFGGKPFAYLHGAGDSAILPNLGSYYVTQIKLDPMDLALDAQLEKQSFDVLPGYRSGTKIEVGMEGVVYLSGRLVFDHNAPATLQIGRIQSLDHNDEKPIPFFTDETGHFEAADLRPGRYGITLSGSPRLSAELTIPADQFGLYEVGDVKLKAAAGDSGTKAH